MSWAVGYDMTWHRDIGYGVPAVCDHPECPESIDRGLAFVCGGEPYGGDQGCGLYFCYTHLLINDDGKQQCVRCAEDADPFAPKPDVAEWSQHKLTDESWQQWRDENPAEVERLRGGS